MAHGALTLHWQKAQFGLKKQYSEGHHCFKYEWSLTRKHLKVYAFGFNSFATKSLKVRTYDFEYVHRHESVEICNNINRTWLAMRECHSWPIFRLKHAFSHSHPCCARVWMRKTCVLIEILGQEWHSLMASQVRLIYYNFGHLGYTVDS